MSNTKSILTAFALAFSTVLVGATPIAAQTQAPAAQQVPLIEPAQVRGLIALGGKITIVDVRRPDETAQGTIPGAILMPLDNLPNTFSSLPKKGKLIVYCRSGHRSAQAVQFLLDHGYKNAVGMNGGYLAWTQH
jgi:rhodanese-related sulfurtransferase